MEGKMVIECGNNGDRSVGIWGLNCKITIEANCDMKDVMSDINYKDNRKLFIQDILNIVKWLDDMDSEIYAIKVGGK